jgi:hypothetical protein
MGVSWSRCAQYVLDPSECGGGVRKGAGLIRYMHRHVAVLNRHGLEAASCECYPIIRGHFDRL